MEWLINRRRMMFNKSLPPDYIIFEDRHAEEMLAYYYGYTTDLTNSCLATGTLNGNGDTQVFSEYIFANCEEITAHGDVPATAARTVEYKLELTVTGNTGSPWDIETPSDSSNEVFAIKQIAARDTVSNRVVVTAEDWANQSVLTQDSNKWTATFSTTSSCQYLRIAIRAALGQKVTWNLISVGTTKVPVGITKKQCTLPTSFPNTFLIYNKVIKKFNEFRYFTNSSFTSTGNSWFASSIIEELTFPPQITLMGTDCIRQSSMRKITLNEGLTQINRNFYELPNLEVVVIPSTVTTIGSGFIYRCPNATVIMRPSTPPTISSTTDWFRASPNVKIYVPDESVDTYKAANGWSEYTSRIKPISEYVES